MTRSHPASSDRRRRGSVLIIVLWICLGLVALTLYFANSMSSELRAAANRVDEAAARQAVAGGIRYAAHVLSMYGTGGAVPHIEDYSAENLPVGDASFWFVGRDPNNPPTTDPYFSLIDESSKLNLNTATRAMLEALPNMTPDIADAIYNWVHAQPNSNADNSYAQMDPPRRNKGAAFETVDELRLVYGVTPSILWGEDTNRNGALDPNEDDGDQSAPRDDHDGQLLPGLFEYVTVYSRLPATSAGGQRRIDIRTEQSRSQLDARMRQRGIDAGRATDIMRRLGNTTYDSVMAFLLDSQMTADEFELIHTDVTATASTNGTQTGLVNVNTAPETVLACIPGIGTDNAATITAYRLAHPDALTSFAWLRDVLRPGDLRRAGQYITDQSYQFSADVAAVGRNGRGYWRERVVFDLSTGTPRIVYRQDLTGAGWALGPTVRATLLAPKDS